MSPTALDKWLKKTTSDDTGLTRPPAEEVGRPRHDSIKREQVLTKVTNVFMTQYSIPTDTNELPKLPTKPGEANAHRVYLIRKCNRNTLP